MEKYYCPECDKDIPVRDLLRVGGHIFHQYATWSSNHGTPFPMHKVEYQQIKDDPPKYMFWCNEGCGFVDESHRCEQWCDLTRIPMKAVEALKKKFENGDLK